MFKIDEEERKIIKSKDFLVRYDKKINPPKNPFNVFKKAFESRKSKQYCYKLQKNSIINYNEEICTLMTTRDNRRIKYRKDIWKKNSFFIIYIVSKFISKLLENYSKYKLKKMKKLHFNLINDKAHYIKKKDFNYRKILKKNYEENFKLCSAKKNYLKTKYLKFKMSN